MAAPVNKIHPSCLLTSKYTEIFVQNNLELFSLVNGAWSVHISLLIQTWQLFLGESIILASIEVKNVLMMDFFIYYKHTAFLDWSHVDYLWIFVFFFFFSAVWTLILTAPSDWRVRDVIQNFSKSVLMKKQTHIHLEWPEGESISFSKCDCLVSYKWYVSKATSLNRIRSTLHSGQKPLTANGSLTDIWSDQS